MLQLATIREFIDDYQILRAVIHDQAETWRIYKITEVLDLDGDPMGFDNDEQEIEWVGAYIVEFRRRPFIWFGKPRWFIEKHPVSWDAMWSHGYAITRFTNAGRIRRIFNLA